MSWSIPVALPESIQRDRFVELVIHRSGKLFASSAGKAQLPGQ